LSAAISCFAFRAASPICQVPCPSRGTVSPEGSLSVGTLDAVMGASPKNWGNADAALIAGSAAGSVPAGTLPAQSVGYAFFVAAGALRRCASRRECSWNASTSRSTPKISARPQATRSAPRRRRPAR
jgi:hypothetical protein